MREPRTTCALVTTSPSADQITPEPAPRPPDWTSTVERRNCSAISPNPGMAMLFPSARPFANHDRRFLGRAAAREFHRDGFADGIRSELSVHILNARDRMRAEGEKQIADHDAGLVRGRIRLDFDDNRRSFFLALERLAQRFWNAYRMQPYAQIAVRNVARAKQCVDHAIHRGGRNRNRAEARETRCGDADRASACVDH